MFKEGLLAFLVSVGTTSAMPTVKPNAKYSVVEGSGVKELTLDTFEAEVMKSSKPVLVYFYAPWCSWCKLMDPVVKEIAVEYPDAKVVQLNVDKYKFPNVNAFPTFIVVVKGEPVWAWQGACTKGNLVGALKPYLKK